MVATSPAVASLALALGKYSTLILRGFCTPQPSETSPLPVYTTFDGIGHQQLHELVRRVLDEEAGLLFGQAIHLLQSAADLALGLGAVPPGHGLVAGRLARLAELGFGLAEFGARLGLQAFRSRAPSPRPRAAFRPLRNPGAAARWTCAPCACVRARPGRWPPARRCARPWRPRRNCGRRGSFRPASSSRPDCADRARRRTSSASGACADRYRAWPSGRRVRPAWD